MDTKMACVGFLSEKDKFFSKLWEITPTVFGKGGGGARFVLKLCSAFTFSEQPPKTKRTSTPYDLWWGPTSQSGLPNSRRHCPANQVLAAHATAVQTHSNMPSPSVELQCNVPVSHCDAAQLRSHRNCPELPFLSLAQFGSVELCEILHLCFWIDASGTARSGRFTSNISNARLPHLRSRQQICSNN